MIPSSTIDYINSSLKMKIIKKIIEKTCKTALKIKNHKDDFISFRISFDTDATFEDNKKSLEIPNEGKIKIPNGLKLLPAKEFQDLIDILIVDDIDFNLDILKRLICSLKESCTCKNNHRDYSIHCASSGKEAIRLVLKQNSLKSGYRLIIMDCMMPEVDGWEATKTILKLYKDKNLIVLPSIIAYSAFDSKEDLDKCRIAGMCSHISKPCYKEELCAGINNWIN